MSFFLSICLPETFLSVFMTVHQSCHVTMATSHLLSCDSFYIIFLLFFAQIPLLSVLNPVSVCLLCVQQMCLQSSSTVDSWNPCTSKHTLSHLESDQSLCSGWFIVWHENQVELDKKLFGIHAILSVRLECMTQTQVFPISQSGCDISICSHTWAPTLTFCTCQSFTLMPQRPPDYPSQGTCLWFVLFLT